MIANLLEVFAQAGGHQQKTKRERGNAGNEQHDNKRSKHNSLLLVKIRAAALYEWAHHLSSQYMSPGGTVATRNMCREWRVKTSGKDAHSAWYNESIINESII